MSEEQDKIVSLEARRVIAEAKKLEPTITQDGIARIFASRHANELRFDHSAGTWHKWTGTHWQRDETDMAFEYARRLAREVSDGSDGKALQSMRRTGFAAGVERFARSDPALAVTAEVWDGVPFLLGTPGGTVELTAGQLRPAEPIEMITKITAVAPADKAVCPIWLRFLDEATGGDPDLIRFLQQWCGYCLTGDTREHALLFGYGDGGTGKGTFLNCITGIMADYAAVADMDTFVVAVGDRHPVDIAALRGARLVAASETEKGRHWAENRVKVLTGGDRVTARFMRGNPFTYRPNFKLTIIGNHAPMLSSVDGALRRRFNIVPFLHKPEKPDHALERKLRAEWPGILRWMIDGCIDWLQNGLIRPPGVLNATENYFAEQDVLAQWLESECLVEIGNKALWANSTELYRSWTKFATTAGKKVETQTAFAEELKKRGFQPNRSGSRGRHFVGICLK